MLYLFENIFYYVLVVSLLLLLGLYSYQNKLIYMPVLPNLPLSPQDNVEGFRSPSDFDITYQALDIPTPDGETLRGWFLQQPHHQDLPTIIFFQGNAGNIGVRLYFLKHYMNQVKANLVVVAYRGYSDSTGSPSEKGLSIDGKAIIDYVVKNIGGRVFVHGRSLGGAVAMAAVDQQVEGLSGLILENTFTNLPDMIDKVMPMLSYLKGLILCNHWPSLDRVQKMKSFKSPVLFISSLKDEIVPFQQMAALYQSCNAPRKTKHVIEEGDHNQAWTKDPVGYFRAIQQVVDQ